MYLFVDIKSCWWFTVDTLLYFLYIHLIQIELSLSNLFISHCLEQLFSDLSTEWPRERSGRKEEACLSQDEFDILVLSEWWGNKAPPSPGNDLRGTGWLWAYATGNLITVTLKHKQENVIFPSSVQLVLSGSITVHIAGLYGTLHNLVTLSVLC